MKKPTTITLADRTYTIQALRLGTIRDIDLARTTDLPTDQKAREAFFFDLYTSVISLALQEDHKEMTVEHILTLRTDLAEIVAAYIAILKLSGLVTENPQEGVPAE